MGNEGERYRTNCGTFQLLSLDQNALEKPLKTERESERLKPHRWGGFGATDIQGVRRKEMKEERFLFFLVLFLFLRPFLVRVVFFGGPCHSPFHL